MCINTLWQWEEYTIGLVSLALNVYLESSKTEINFLIIRGDDPIMMVETIIEFENLFMIIYLYTQIETE